MRRSTFVLLAVVGLLLAFVLLWERKAPSTSEREAHREDLLPGVKAETLARLERSGFDPLRLVRSGTASREAKEDGEASPASWKLETPLKDAADRYGVEGFAERLLTARVLRPVSSGASPSGLGLDPPRAVWTLSTEKGQSWKVEVGGEAPLEEGLYLRTGGKVVLVAKDLESLLLRPASDFRLKELLTVGTSEIAAVEVERPDRSRLAFHRKGEAWNVTAPYQDWAADEKVLALLDDLSLCPVLAFPAQGGGETGLQGPATRVFLGLRNGSALTLTLGGPAPGGDPAEKRVYAVSSERPGLLVVSQRSLASLERGAEEFRSLEAFRRSVFDADEVAVTGPRPLRLRHDREKGWLWEGESGRNDDAVVLAGHLASLRGTKALPPPTTPPENPWTFSVKGPDFQERLTVWSSGGQVLGRPLGRPVALVLDGEGWKAVEALLKGTKDSTSPKGGPP